MPSTYTLNNGIELISTGEQSGTWGDTTNTNLSLVDAALDGQVTVTLSSAGSSGSPNALPISDGATSNGRNRVVIFNDGSDLGATAYVQLTPNDAEKIIYVRNSLSGSRSIILFQGTYSASNDYEVPAGTTAVVFFDGAGSGAVAANVFNNAYFDSLRLGSVSVTAILDEDNMSSNSATALATQQSIKAYVDTQVGANNELSEVLANGNTTGSNNIVVNNGQAITTNTVNETTSGSGVTIDSVLLKDDGVNATNLEVTNLKANDGTAAGSIANSTGAFTITSLISNSVDIGGGAIDGTVIGGSTPAAISGTTGSFSGNVSLGDNDELRFGAGNDLILEHNGSNGDIRNNTNDLLIRNLADDRDVIIQSDDGSGGTADYFRADGSSGEAKLFYYGSEKLNTSSGGVSITGNLAIADNGRLRLGASNDLDIYHDGVNSYIAETGTGALIFRSNNYSFRNSANTEQIMQASENGAVALYYDNSAKLATSSTGVDVTGNVSLGDNDELRLGDSDDLTIEHNATNGIIANNTNNLYLTNTANDKDVYIQSDDGSGGIANYFAADGSTGEAKMYYYGSVKVTTQSYGAHISGALTLSAADPYIKLTDTSTGVDHEIDANSGVGNLVINADINAEGSEPKLLLKVTGTTGITVRDTGNVDIAGDLGVDGNAAFDNDIDVNGVDIGRGGGNISTNTTLGTQTLEDNTTGLANVAVGYQALPNNTTGSNNTATGRQALFYNTTGSNNSANGCFALLSNTTGNNNSATGSQALTSNTTGSSNTATGYLALNSNTTGNNNSATGLQALYSNTTGGDNSAHGRQALYNNSTGNNNTANGFQALYNNTTGGQNSATGKGALLSNTTGNSNTANGYQALYFNTTGSYSTATGRQALISNTTGVSGTATGYQALYSNTTGDNNSAHGAQALYSNTTGSSNSAHGLQALYSNTTGSSNTADGYRALYQNTTGVNNSATGLQALYSNTTGSSNTATGLYALRFNTTGNNNSAYGVQALDSNTTGVNNTADGYRALYNNTTGDQNSAFGFGALDDCTTGDNNVAIGKSALGSLTTGSGNFGAGFITSSGSGSPVFSPTTENNRVVMGHTAVTNAYVQVAWTVVSDERDKTEIEPMQQGLDFVEQLNPVSYKFRKDRDTEETNGKKRYGFLAQDVLAVEGEDNVIVDNEDPDKLRMTHEELIPVLVNAIKELKVEIETLKGN